MESRRLLCLRVCACLHLQSSTVICRLASKALLCAATGLFQFHDFISAEEETRLVEALEVEGARHWKPSTFNGECYSQARTPPASARACVLACLRGCVRSYVCVRVCLCVRVHVGGVRAGCQARGLI